MKSHYRVKSQYETNCRAGSLIRHAAVAVMTLAVALMLATSQSRAQQRIALVNATHTSTVNVTLGKSLDVRTDQDLVDIAVGDPTVADVNPLTDRALSILGKKIGTTRVTVYGQDKKAVGIFDVEVSYDISRLAAEIANFSGGGIRVSSVNGRILLSGTAPDAVTLDKAVSIARQFVPDPINTVQVTQPQQIMLEVRFIEVSRQASREFGVQWNVFGSRTVANIGNQAPASQLPITTPYGAFQQPQYAVPGNGVGGLNQSPANATISPVVAAGVLSGAAPFGFLVSQLGELRADAAQRAGAARPRAQPSGAQSGRVIG